ncbi:2-oxoglutarate-dependent dioxygenase DAO-like [Humulus lupulus]|uniref:2-oxoglutarate-dependent dioxygenase DAO-like n=1 Tax=Humulus lupulus TaxID=3486 RepID=UPI002B417D67|nr:2-oxoglutarate-dependent dioxygenase DAO-like [Humulus lupulus]
MAELEDEEMMMSSNSRRRSVPVIDLREFEDEKAYTKLREACEEWGCFRIINHSIPLDLMSQMKTVVRSLLDLPPEIKARNTDAIAGSGYVAPSPANPLYEALGLYDFGSPEALRCFCDQLDVSPHQREIIERYGRAVYGLGLEIGRKMGKSLGLERDVFKGWPSQFRINKYNFSDLTLGSSGVQIHTDNSFLTILQEDEDVGGLELITKNGEFVAVDPCPGTLLLNLGDIATVWSNGRFYNVKHRVVCKEATIRVSIASFMLGPKEEAVEAPEELVDSEHPRLYLPFHYEHYRKLRLSTKLRAGEALQLLRPSPHNNTN